MVILSKRKLYRYAFSSILTIVLTALLFSGILISVVNDIYAFVKPKTSYTLNIDTPISLNELSARLQSTGVIENPTVFSLYAKSKGRKQELEAFCGTLDLRSDMSYREILYQFAN